MTCALPRYAPLLTLLACAGEERAASLEVAAAAPPAEQTLALEAPRTLREEGGLRLEEQGWSWGEERGTAWRVSVPLPGRATVSPARSVVEFDALLPADAGPWAAINGGFYDPEGRAMGLVVSGGRERSAFVRGGGSGVFFVGPAGPAVVHRDAWKPGPAEALQSIDRLVDEGRSLVKRREGPLAARSAVAVGADRLWLLALAGEQSVVPLSDGARLDATAGNGLPLGVFAEWIVRSTGAITALNLDGAVSTQLAVRTSAGAFRVRGERGTINAIVLRP